MRPQSDLPIPSRRFLTMFAVSFAFSGLGVLLSACEGEFTGPPPMEASPPAFQLAPASAWLAVDLGTLGGVSSSARGINQNGQIVGSSTTAGGEGHPFLWEGGQMTDLGTLSGYSNCGARAINDLGRVVGSCQSLQQEDPLAPFVWEDGVLSPLSLPAGFTGFAPHAISNDGQVVGFATTGTTEGAYLWEDGELTEVVPPDGHVLYNLDINNHGQVSATYFANGFHAFVWDAGQTTPVSPVTGDTDVEAIGLNDPGQVVGLSWDFGSSTIVERGYVWEDGQSTAFTSPGDVTHTQPNDINNLGMAAGLLFSATTGFRAFAWQAGQMVVLNGLSDSWGWALDLNDAGQVVGFSRNNENQTRAALWMATQEFDLVFEQLTSTLVADGTLTAGQAQALTAKVDRALVLHEQGKTGPALALVRALTNQIQSLIAAGVLTQADAEALLWLAATLQGAVAG